MLTRRDQRADEAADCREVVGRHVADLAEDRNRARGVALAQNLFAHRQQRLDLGLRRRLALAFDFQLREQLVERLGQLTFGSVIGQVGDRLAAMDRIHCRDRLNAELGGDQLVVVDIDLGQLDAFVGVISGDFLEHRSELLARLAPLGPEVEHHQRRHRRLDDVLFEAPDRLAFGFAQPHSRHGRVIPLRFALNAAHMGGSRGGHKRPRRSLAGQAFAMLGARLTSAGKA